MNVINRLKELLERVPVRLNSRNSGISPSKNLFPPPRSESDPDDGDGAPKRKLGGQVGHERNIRGVFTEQMAKRIVDWTTLNSQPCRGVELERYPERDILREKYEKPPDPVERNMREIFAYRCPKCGKIHHAYAPPEIMDKSLLDDALLVDLLVYKTMNTILVRKLQAIYSDLLGVNISTGGLVDLSKAVGSMLRPICLEAPHSVKHQPLFYIDETSFRIMKKRMYTWVFESPDLMVFKNGTRSRFILDSVLGEWYVGILVSDAYGACVGFVKDAPGATGMLCWARFRRDLKLCMDHGGKAARDFGGSLNIIMDDTFAAFNDYKVLEDKNSPEALELYVKLRKIQKILPRRIKVIITLVRNPVLIRDCFQYLAAGVIVYF